MLESYNSDDLRVLIGVLPYKSTATRKADRLEFLVKALTSPESLRQLWGHMDDLQRTYVAEAYHNGGEININAFVSRYGKLPQRSKRDKWSYREDPILADLIVHNLRIPDDLMPVLAGLVPALEPFRLDGIEQAPVSMATGKETLPLLRADTEAAGWHDLIMYLHMLDEQKITISTNGKLTPKSVHMLAGSLMRGDFLPLDAETKFDDTIRPAGLHHFALAADLVNRRSGKLTAQGRALVDTEDPELLLTAVETWTAASNYDELSRLSHIRGQRARGLHLTNPAERRDRIVEALSWCPVGVWIDVAAFYRALIIWHFDFSLEEGGAQNLYVGYRYGSRGYYEPWADTTDAWLLVNGLYVNAVLWETLATLGALDILFVAPDDADFPAITYTDTEGDYYSRYDGLKYFRITPLGAYLLGQAGAYTHAKAAEPPPLAVRPDGQIQILDAERMTPVVHSRLAQIAVPVGENLYRLDATQVLGAIAEGADPADFVTFMERVGQQPLPAEVAQWFDAVVANSVAFSVKSEAVLIRPRTAALAQLAVDDQELNKYCRLLDERTLVVTANRVNAFGKRLHELGYGLDARK